LEHGHVQITRVTGLLEHGHVQITRVTGLLEHGHVQITRVTGLDLSLRQIISYVFSQ
jgi:hypothetical protein